MPIQREHLQFAVIVLCVPLQLFISSYMGSTEANRTYAISRLVTQISEIKENWLKVEPWRKWCYRFMSIKHKLWGYRGVIIGWDEVARAPANWIQEMHKNNPSWQQQPNYAILVDTRDRPAPQITYVPQENMEVVKHTKILHPSVEDYFENFDGSQYLPRPWLRSIYSRD